MSPAPMIMRLWHRLERFFFEPVPATGFGLMRMGWAATALGYFLVQWPLVTELYSNAGILPTYLASLVERTAFRFSILDIVTDPTAVFTVYLALVTVLLLTMIGLAPRLSLIASLILMFSFHERNIMILGGGDTTLRVMGFILAITPDISPFSVSRLRRQWAHWKTHCELLPTPMQPIWPYRLVVWQFIIIYVTSVWYKLMGTMWIAGTATGATLNHLSFLRFPQPWYRPVYPFTPFITWFTLVWETAWILLLLPRSFTRRALLWEPQGAIRRWLIALGLMFHGGIQLMMHVGSFSFAMVTSYAGLLLGEDFAWMKRTLNRRRKGQITVLYDGHCGLCKRSVFTLQLLDWLQRLEYVDFWNTAARTAIAPELKMNDLNKAMHIRLHDGRTLKGFDAIRYLAWHFPALWFKAPFLYLPGIAHLGRLVYARVAERRKKCTHESCAY